MTTATGKAVLANQLCGYISDALQTANHLPAEGTAAREFEALHMALHEAAHLAGSIHHVLKKEADDKTNQLRPFD